MNNPTAFAETYWSINSLRVYNESGKPAKSSSLSAGAIAGIVIGAIVGLGLILCLVWRWRKRRQNKRAVALDGESEEEGAEASTPKPYSFLASSSGGNMPALSGGNSASSSRSNLNSKKGKLVGINLVPKNPKGNIQANGYAREGKTKLAPGKSARHYLAGETPLAAKIPGDDEGISRRGSAASGPKAFQGGGDWVALASGGSRRGSQAPSLGGKGWVG